MNSQDAARRAVRFSTDIERAEAIVAGFPHAIDDGTASPKTKDTSSVDMVEVHQRISTMSNRRSLRDKLFSKNGVKKVNFSPESIPLGPRLPKSKVVRKISVPKRRDSSWLTKSSLPNYNKWAEQKDSKSKLGFCLRFVSNCGDWIFHRKEYVPEPGGRSIRLEPTIAALQIEKRTNKPYVDNTITSSRYTIYNFVPRQLLFQFSKVANVYFMSIAILQMIPGLSTTGSYTTIIPLMFFISISILREGIDDYRRHRMDNAENNKPVYVFATKTSGKGHTEFENEYWHEKKWFQLRVGDIVRLKQNDWIPADLILLNSKGTNGVAYIETAALDGETNLKARRALPLISKHCMDEAQLASVHAVIQSEAPNQDLYNYEGKMIVGEDIIPLTSDEIMYRGTILRNTSEAWAIVVFTGEESKIRLNASKNIRIKAPSMQMIANKIVLIIILFVVLLAIFCTVAYYVWHEEIEVELWYLRRRRAIAFLPIAVSFVILYNTMVPLSLYVSMEITKLLQTLLLQQDIDMYHEESDTPAEARTSTINEELGQVSHIFTDKTGTLTDNIMVFRSLSVAGHSWLHDLDIQAEAASDRPFLLHKKRKGKKAAKRSNTITAFAGDLHKLPRSKSVGTEQMLVESKSRNFSNIRNSTSHITGEAPTNDQPTLHTTLEMLGYVQHHPYTVFARKARMFLIAIAVCHTCLPEQKLHSSEDGDSALGSEVTYSAASPDELALVNAAKELGYIVTDRDVGEITLRTYPNGRTGSPVDEVYKVLDVIEFTSKRKRMSIIVKFPDGRICVICKGADSFLIDRMKLHDMAKKKWHDVQKQVDIRRSIEAERVFARNSMIAARPSISIARPSLAANRMEMIRDLDDWLGRHRDDGDFIDEPLSTRPSMQYVQSDARHSMAYGETKQPLERLVSEDDMVDEQVALDDATCFEQTFRHIHTYASEGLRTLVYGHRFLQTDEYASWRKVYQEATTSLVDRQKKVEQAGELIEIELELTGATAIEDKLQHGVPEAIDKLRRSGIKLFMLTGDKRETAINIGHSCRLIKDFSEVIILDMENESMAELMATSMLDLQEGKLAHSVIVIDGATMTVIEADKGLLALLVDLSVCADSVICCRASPSQKASMVKYVRKRVKNSVTLAIGDGANDIAMIREAHVGIGITGKEGLQAARSSDYSIAQFRFLLKLLLVHGRWNYVRTSKYILSTFYKEIFFFLTQAIYQRFVGYTGTSLHENWSLSVFNTLFSSLCVITVGTFEKDLSAFTLLAVPELYAKGREGKGFTVKLFLAWMVLACSQSVLLFYGVYFAFGRHATSDNTIFPFGDMIFTAAVIVINTKLFFIEMHHWSILSYVMYTITIGGWFAWNMLLSFAYGKDQVYQVKGAFVTRFGRDISWWAALFLVVSTLLLGDIGLKALRASFYPTDEDVFREIQNDVVGKARLEAEAAIELQAGWDRGKRLNSNELEREREIQELLDRPREMLKEEYDEEHPLERQHTFSPSYDMATR